MSDGEGRRAVVDELTHWHGRHSHTHEHRGPHRHLLHPRRAATLARDDRSPLHNPVYRRLLAAQVVALIGTGVSTVALSLLAYSLATANAGAVLGAALALKMVAYVGLSPVIAAFAHRLDRRRLLIGLDLARVAVLALLPFVTEIWQVFVLIFVVNACAAGHTPAFQATIPEVLPDEREYTRALSFSRLSYDLSELLSPVAAAVLLLVVDFHGLFALNAVSFLIAAGLIASTRLPNTGRDAPVSDRTWARITVGVRRYLTTPRLRALLALNLAVACASAMTIVNTVILVRDDLGLGDSAVAIALGAAGTGSAITALLLPSVLDHLADRTVMLAGGALLAIGLPIIALGPSYPALLGLWLILGVGLSLVQTPSGLLIQRSADDATRPALFAAQFSLSHACWLLTYPIAGVVGAAAGIGAVAIGLGAVAAITTVVASLLWGGDRS